MNDEQFEPARRRLAEIRVPLGKYYQEFVDAIDLAIERPPLAGTQAGKCAEALLYRIHELRLETTPHKETLEPLIQKVSKFLPEPIKIHLSVIQRFRNHGSHHQSTSLQSSDLVTAIFALVAFAEWYAKEHPETERAASASSLTVSRRKLIIVAAIMMIGVYYWNSLSNPLRTQRQSAPVLRAK